MFVFNRVTFAAACLSSIMIFMTIQMDKAQSQDSVLEDRFDANFIVTSPIGSASSHTGYSFILGQTNASFNSNYSFFSNLKLSTQIQKIASNNYDLNILLTTGSSSGFIPPETTLGNQAVNEWRFDIGNFFSGSNNGIDFPIPVIYNSAQGNWFDDGNLVFQSSYLFQLSTRSTPTQLFGQFDIGLSSGDLGAFGNGIDTFALKVNVTVKEQTVPAVPEPSTSSALLISTILGLALSQQRKAKKPCRLP